LHSFGSYFDETNSAANQVMAALDEFSSGIGQHIAALKSAKRAWKAIEDVDEGGQA
jgi:hypothetical protein